MPKYLAGQIHKGKLDYDAVIAKYPAFKTEIDAEIARLESEEKGVSDAPDIV